MLLSLRCEYAVRTALYLAATGRTDYVAVREISEALGIPRHFLAKTVQPLTASGVLVSMRGPAGGLALGRSADRITIEDIVLVVDGADVFTECVLGLPGCGDQKPCPLHDQWGPVRDRLHDLFVDATLADAVAHTQADDFRLGTL